MSVVNKYQIALNEIAVHYRALTAEDAPAYRDIRLHALSTEGEFFTAKLNEERDQTIADWRNACAETTKQITYGAFAGNDLIAVSSACEIESNVVKWGSTYIQPELRRAHIVQALYVMREDWSFRQGYIHAEFTIRADNQRSRDIHEKYGAHILEIKPMEFADGSVAPTVRYRKLLSAGRQRASYQI